MSILIVYSFWIWKQQAVQDGTCASVTQLTQAHHGWHAQNVRRFQSLSLDCLWLVQSASQIIGHTISILSQLILTHLSSWNGILVLPNRIKRTRQKQEFTHRAHDVVSTLKFGRKKVATSTTYYLRCSDVVLQWHENKLREFQIFKKMKLKLGLGIMK